MIQKIVLHQLYFNTFSLPIETFLPSETATKSIRVALRRQSYILSKQNAF